MIIIKTTEYERSFFNTTRFCSEIPNSLSYKKNLTILKFHKRPADFFAIPMLTLMYHMFFRIIFMSRSEPVLEIIKVS